jgi:hypothetical protein
MAKKKKKDNKNLTILTLVTLLGGSFLLGSYVFGSKDYNSIQTSVLDSSPNIKLASDYKPCGNTIKCPPPPPIPVEEAEETTDTPPANSNNNSSSNNYTPPKNEEADVPATYQPSPGEINDLEYGFVENEKIALNLEEEKRVEADLKEALGKQGETIAAKTADGDDSELTQGANIKFVNNLVTAKKERDNKKAFEIIIDPSTDTDGDRLSDLSEIAIYGSDPFNPDSDGDGIKDGHEIDYGTDPSSANKPDLSPGITNLHGLVTDQNPLVKGVASPGQEISIDAYNIETNEVITVCTVTADKIGKFVCQPDEELATGIYYFYSNHLSEDHREIARVTIEENHPPKEESTAKVETLNKDSTDKKLAAKEFLTKYIGGEIVDKFIIPRLEALVQLASAKKQILSGEAQPGEIILITWQSFSINSVVIADASQGSYEALVPKELEAGEHKVFVYAYNPDTNFMRNISSLIFSTI